MADWPATRLGCHLRVKHGFAFEGEHFGNHGDHIVLTPGNFVETGGFKDKSGAEKYYTATPPAEYVLQCGDLVVAMTEQSQGLLGSSAMIPIDNLYLHNQRIGLVEPISDDVELRFLYYLFNAPPVRAQIQATATGAKVRHTAPKRIEDLTVRVPPLPTQRKIVEILSAYDDLIENNSRRIKALEEMVQRIYREWFVDFRYTGHDEVALVNSELGPIPHGWHVVPLGEIMELVYGKALPGNTRRNGSVAVYGSSGFIGIHDEALCDGPGIVIGRKGNVGAVHWVDDAFFPIDTTYWVRTALPLQYCYYALQDMDFVDSHAAVPGLSRSQAYSLPVCVPDRRIAASFAELVEPAFSLRRCLNTASRGLRASREILLPRLISGELEVSERDTVASEFVA